MLNSLRLTWNLDSVAAEIGAYYMDNADSHLEASRLYIKKEREWLADAIGRIKGLLIAAGQRELLPAGRERHGHDVRANSPTACSKSASS